MKIIWFCIPAHGHTNPTLGLVKALTGAGHTVYYFSYEMFREKVESAGAVFFSCDEYSFEEQDKGYPVKGILEIVTNDNDTNTIVYTSKYFQPCAETFSDRYRFIGPSIRPISKKYEKSADNTVYISMGTINSNREFYRNCINALGKTDYQVIISMGTNTDHFDNVPDNIRIYESVDQMAVLSISDAFITHCGMN